MTSTSLFRRVFVMAVVAASVDAHFSFTDRSQIACDINAKDGINWLPHPILEGAPYSQWWMHGQVNCQAKAQSVFALPAGGTVAVAMSSRNHMVPPPNGWAGGAWRPSNPDAILSESVWNSGQGNSLSGNHNIHAEKRGDPSGCALAIAYKSDAKLVTPKDFVIFSVVRDCPKRQREYMKVPKLPACPNGKCICAWFWIPKNSGAKNFYMTPFVCNVVGTPGTSPVDVEYATPPRRCLDPKLCNFGPRQPMYWLGAASAHINSPEDILQSPHYSIRYGFRDGAQNDIFVNSNPWRKKASGFPTEMKCSGKPSRLTSTSSSFTLTSPNCKCTAKLSGGKLTISRDINPTGTSFSASYSSFGPAVIMADPKQKASTYYFPKAQAPYRVDLNDLCYLVLSDNKGLVMWESAFSSGWQKLIVDSFKGSDPDPSVWPSQAAVEETNMTETCTAAVNTVCSAANMDDCTVGTGSDRCGPCKTGYKADGTSCVVDSDPAPVCDVKHWSAKAGTADCSVPCRTLAWTVAGTCKDFCTIQGLTCTKAFEDNDNSCTDTKEEVTCDTDFRTKFAGTSDMVCECAAPKLSIETTNEANIVYQNRVLNDNATLLADGPKESTGPVTPEEPEPADPLDTPTSGAPSLTAGLTVFSLLLATGVRRLLG